MGLGMDYDIFLVSRIREEVLNGKTDEEAILAAVEPDRYHHHAVRRRDGRGLRLHDALSHGEEQEIGFALCLAVILDATLMRLVIVPSIMVLMKKYNWWMPFVKSEEQKPEEEKKKRAPKPLET